MTDNTILRPRARRAVSTVSAVGAAALLSTATMFGLPAATAQPGGETGLSQTGQDNIADLGSCIAATKSADILLIIDQSESLKGFDGEPPTDPRNVRVDATRDLVNQLGIHAGDLNADINVKLAGFGDGYHNDTSDYGGWVNVRDGVDELDDPIDGFTDRNEDGYTSYRDALNGALTEFASAPTGEDGQPSDCQSVLFFTDGAVTDKEKSSEAAAEDVCRPGSPLASLRNSGVRFFSVGLIPQSTANPRELLTRMAEEDCGGAAPNGAFFDAGTDPAGLLASFRNFIPTANSIDSTLSMNEPQPFTLDNSITTVRLSAQPTTSIGDGITPVLTSPDGDELELTEGEHTVGGAEVNVTTTDAVDGMVDADLTLADGESWEGEWSFGYDTSGADAPDAARYNAKVVLEPGLTVKVDELDDGIPSGMKSDEVLTASLVDRDGAGVDLEGEATMTAHFIDRNGRSTDLGEPTSVSDGDAVEFPLDAITEPTAGDVVVQTNITTKASGSAPGTALSPIVVGFPVTVTPVNMPTLGSADLTIDSRETEVSVPVTGPGKVWVADASYSAGDGPTVLPEGVDQVSVSSPHNSADNALELAEGETADLPVTVSTEDLADGRVSVTPTVNLVSAEGDSTAEIDVELTGSMSAPVNTAVFIATLIGVLLAAILIPLGVLYLMKWFTGRIPGSPGIHALRIPVSVDNGRLVRPDTGGAFTVGFDEIVSGTPRVTSTGREVNLAGTQVRVKLGANPLSAPYAVVDATPSISDEGLQVKDSARLPLAVHNHWFVIGTPGDPSRGEVVLAVDERITDDRLTALVGKITTDTPDLLNRLSTSLAETGTAPGSGAGAGGDGGAASDPAAGAAGAAPFSPDAGASPFGGPATGWGSPSDGGPSGTQPGTQSGPDFGDNPFGSPGSSPFGPR